MFDKPEFVADFIFPKLRNTDKLEFVGFFSRSRE